MPSDPSDERVLDSTRLRVTTLPDTLRDLVDQIKFTNSHVARPTRDIGELRSDMNGFRSLVEGRFARVEDRFDRMERELFDLRNERLLQANQILGAQQDARRALTRIEDLLEARSAGPEGGADA
jgi:hypothetical protein